MTRFVRILRDKAGAALVEMALALPVLILIIYGIFQFGMLLQASSGMQHALGEGARYATIWPTPTDLDIQSRIASKVYGTDNGVLLPAVIVPGVNYKDITLVYAHQLDFLFFPGPTVTLTRSKRVYVSA